MAWTVLDWTVSEVVKEVDVGNAYKMWKGEEIEWISLLATALSYSVETILHKKRGAYINLQYSKGCTLATQSDDIISLDHDLIVKSWSSQWYYFVIAIALCPRSI